MLSHDFRFVPSPIFKIDSRIVTFKMTVNPNPTGDLTQDFSSCKIDPIAMKYNPVRIRYEQELFATGFETCGTGYHGPQILLENSFQNKRNGGVKAGLKRG